MYTIMLWLTLSLLTLNQVTAIDHLRSPQSKNDNDLNAFSQPLIVLDEQIFEDAIVDRMDSLVKDE